MGEQSILPGVDVCGFKLPKQRRIATADGWNPTLKYNLVQREDQLEHMIDVLRWAQADGWAWDTETSGLKPELGARIAGHCFAARTGEREMLGWYVPVRHIGPHNEHEEQIPLETVVERLRPLFAEEEGEVITYHAKFDAKLGRADGLELRRPIVDIAIEATAENENEPRFALKALAGKYCSPAARNEEKELKDWLRKDAHALGLVFDKYNKKQRAKLRQRGLDELSHPTYLDRFGFARAPVKLAARYGIHDAFYTWWLHKSRYRHVRSTFPALWEREHAVMRMLLDMEWRGLPADEACIRDTHERTKAAVQHWLDECRRLHPSLPETFEASDTDLRNLFYIELGMKPPKLTGKSGKPSVDKESRLILEHRYPDNAELLQAIGTLATVSKIHSTYAGAFLRHYSPVTKSIHPTYNQLERREEGGWPVTGRLSSADPNAQNVRGGMIHLWNCGCGECLLDRAVELAEEWWGWDEKATKRLLEQGGQAADGLRQWAKLGRLDVPNTVSIQRYFIVPEGWVRAYIDFSQIELRVLAWFCQDPVMLAAYREGRDLHQAIADELGIARKIAKQVNFGNSYGMTKFGLALRLPGYFKDPEGTIAQAEQILEAYFARFPRILAFRREFAMAMRRTGNMFVNPFGRPRRIPDISAQGEDRWKRKRAERMMMSSIISGTSADLMKESMRRTNPIACSVGGAMVQTIHDELVFDLPRQSGWSGTVVQLVRAMEDWPMFSEDRPDLPLNAPGRYGVPIEASVELSTTTWEDKREIELVGDGFRWAA